MLTARCSRVGWDVAENTIAKVEAQIRCVSDREIVCLARALGSAYRISSLTMKRDGITIDLEIVNFLAEARCPVGEILGIDLTQRHS